jgi:hypothetical protein
LTSSGKESLSMFIKGIFSSTSSYNTFNKFDIFCSSDNFIFIFSSADFNDLFLADTISSLCGYVPADPVE